VGECVVAVMPRNPWLVGGSAAVAMAVVVGTAVAARTLDVPKTARIGDPLTIRASGGLTPALFYRATFTESAKGRHAGRQCARNIDRPYRAGTSTTRVYVSPAWGGCR
jgi:hypothetical protein